jgi:hypothetical protein
MLSFVASQAFALSKVKHKPSGVSASGQQSAVRHVGKRFFSRVFCALLAARMRRVDIEIEHHPRYHEGQPK